MWTCIVSAAVSVAIPCYLWFFAIPYETRDPIPREFPPGSALALLRSACWALFMPAHYIAMAVLPHDWRYISPPNDNPYIRIPTYMGVVILVNALLWAAVSGLIAVIVWTVRRRCVRKNT